MTGGSSGHVIVGAGMNTRDHYVLIYWRQNREGSFFFLNDIFLCTKLSF